MSKNDIEIWQHKYPGKKCRGPVARITLAHSKKRKKPLWLEISGKEWLGVKWDRSAGTRSCRALKAKMQSSGFILNAVGRHRFV